MAYGELIRTRVAWETTYLTAEVVRSSADKLGEFSFGGSILFGYEKIVRHSDRYTLEGENVPTLHQGMRVALCGDSRHYVPGGFRHGENVEIVAFRQPFQDGVSDEIICVTNGGHDDWVKPSNISSPHRPLSEGRENRTAEEDEDLAPVPGEAAASPLHIEILQKGAEHWNKWRLTNPNETPRPAGADLRGLDLRHINLEGADLSSIEGYGVDLYHANPKRANLHHAFMQSANA
jgi:hypothetical protein